MALGALVTAGGDVPVAPAAGEDMALKAPVVDTSPGPEYAADTRIFQGIPGIERAPNGRLWATWYGGGPTEGPWNYVMLVTSADDGATWSDLKLVVNPTDPVRAFDPCLWVDPTGRMWLFWAQAWDMWDGRAGVWAIVTDDPDSAEPQWSGPRRLADGVMMNKPVALSSGHWLLPAAVWSMGPNAKDPAHRFDLGSKSGSNAIASPDQGATWIYQGGSNVPTRACDEHHIVELKDGRLWALVRTAYGIGESFSSDGGRTWSPGKPSWIPHIPSARFFIRRLASGKLLLVKHTPPDGRTRSHLTAYLSEDDGKTWSGGLMIDDRAGVSYPDATQAPDGTIYLIYDYSRYAHKQVLMATFTEEDVIQGRPDSDKARLHIVVNQATGKTPPAATTLSSNDDAASLLTDKGAAIVALEGATDILSKGARVFTNRDYVVRDLPEFLEGASFVRSSIDRDEIVCKRGGVLYVMTPLSNRNRDSLELELYRKNFQRAAVPEFFLFGEAEGNICTVFQKHVDEGEKLVLGKWGVVVIPKDQ